MKKPTNAMRLKSYFRHDKYIRTSDIIRWGSQNYCNGAARIARKLAEDGEYIRRLTKSEQILAGFDTSEGVYERI